MINCSRLGMYQWRADRNVNAGPNGYGTGMTGGAAVSFTKRTTNFADRVPLAFLDTTCTSVGDS